MNNIKINMRIYIMKKYKFYIPIALSIIFTVLIICFFTFGKQNISEVQKNNVNKTANRNFDSEREANKLTYQDYIEEMPLPDSGNSKKEKQNSLFHEIKSEENSKPKPEEIEDIKIYTEIYEDLSFPPPTPNFSQEPVSNFITVEMDVELIKNKIKNKEIRVVEVLNEKGDVLSFEYSGVYFDKKYPETFSAGFRNKTGRLTLSGHYGDTNFRGQFMDRGHTTNILIKNNKGYVYSVN